MFRDLICATVIAAATLAAQTPKPTCVQCPSTYIPKSELDAYTKKAIKYNITDQQVRSVDVGKSQAGIGMVTRKMVRERAIELANNKQNKQHL